MNESVAEFAERFAARCEQQARKCEDSIGIADDALIAAACWNNAARWVRKMAEEGAPDAPGQ